MKWNSLYMMKLQILVEFIIIYISINKMLWWFVFLFFYGINQGNEAFDILEYIRNVPQVLCLYTSEIDVHVY